MKDWQRDYITTNFPQFLRATICSRNLLTKLRAKELLGNDDLDILDAVVKMEGKSAQAQKLYNILMTRSGAYDILMEELYHDGQTGAGSILIKRYVLNNESIPFDLNKSPFNWKDEVPPTGNVLHQTVLVQKTPTTLSDILDRVSSQNKSMLLECLDEDIENKIMQQLLPYELVIDNIPTSINHPELTYSTRSRLNKTVFEVPNDIFLVKGIDRVKLSVLTNGQPTANLVNILSSKQLPNERFIVDTGEIDFPQLCKKYSNKTVHLLEWTNDSLVWCRTVGHISALRKHIDSKQMFMNEEQFMEDFQVLVNAVEGNSNISVHFCITMAAELDKTIANNRLAHWVRKMFPKNLIFYFELEMFLEKLQDVENELPTAGSIKQMLTEEYTYDGFAASVLTSLLDSQSEHVFLFLEGGDDTQHIPIDHMKSVFQVIKDEMANIIVVITTLSNLTADLEDCFGTLGYSVGIKK